MSKIIEITDFHAPELDIYARLTEGQLLNRHEPEKGMFIAESPKVVERALDAGYLPVSFLVEHRHLESQAKDLICRCPEAPVYTAEFDVLTQLTGFQLTRGMLCAMHRRPLPSVKEICAGAKRIAVLENVVNPTNVGAIFRSAAALHVDAVLLTEACSNPLYRRSIRVSMGTVFQVPWARIDMPLSRLHDWGLVTVAMALRQDALPPDAPQLVKADRLALILGTEGEGLPDAVVREADHVMCIPMAHGVDSLNVAAASAVAFWALRPKPRVMEQ